MELINSIFLQSDSLAPPWKSEGVLAPRLAAGEEGEDGGGAEKKKPTWLNRSKEGGIKKLPKEVVRRRRNFRLKKMLTPKVQI